MKFFIGHALGLGLPHDWFAWHPVVARQSTPNGTDYHVVWLSRVKRKAVSAMGVVQFSYELPEKTVNDEMR